jgi:hypothetical protein
MEFCSFMFLRKATRYATSATSPELYYESNEIYKEKDTIISIRKRGKDAPHRHNRIAGIILKP